MVGLTSVLILDDRGNTLDIEISGTEDLDSMTTELTQSLSQVSAPLPAEPVGVGARYQVVQPLSLLGVDIEQIATYTVTDITGAVVTMDVSTVQNVPPGSSITQGGVTTEILSWTTIGEGTMKLDLTTFVPTSSMTTATIQELEIPGAGVVKQWLDAELAISAE